MGVESEGHETGALQLHANVAIMEAAIDLKSPDVPRAAMVVPDLKSPDVPWDAMAVSDLKSLDVP